jgi:hypothetical protein
MKTEIVVRVGKTENNYAAYVEGLLEYYRGRALHHIILKNPNIKGLSILHPIRP